jgi:hypothetical protein
MNPSAAFSHPIPAGAADSSDTELCFEYADGYGPDSMRAQPVNFTVVVWSGEYPFWTGTFAFAGPATGFIEIVGKGDLPTAFRLGQNYPNPFNPITVIKYELPRASHVTLKIYNTLGQEVATVVDENKPAGVHTAQFDATGLASGVYLYRLTAGNFVEAKKLTVLQ